MIKSEEGRLNSVKNGNIGRVSNPASGVDAILDEDEDEDRRENRVFLKKGRYF